MEIIDRNLNDFYYGGPYPKKYPVGIEKVLMRKLQMIDAAAELEDLRVPPGESPGAVKGKPIEALQHQNQLPMAHRVPVERKAEGGL